MKFRKQRAIYLQIADHLCDNIIKRKWSTGEKIPSVRETAVSVEVNPNTVMRTYAELELKGIIYNRRGIGFFVAADAIEKIVAIKKNAFLEIDVPHIFRTMDLLGFSFKELRKYYDRYRLEGGKDENKQ